ncbi:MAG: M24 family metallopeptidase [Bacteroidetes bacterium]|nr:M24 family metallopeptidase [Bacteroidota bacterium]
MSKLREVKQAEEIALMRKAINISCKAHLELMKALDSGMNEYQAQAILEYVFKNEGAEARIPFHCGKWRKQLHFALQQQS